MKKIKGSICAKIAAWIGITLSGIAFAGSTLGAILMWEQGIYQNTRENLKEQAFDSVSRHYSVRALDNWYNGEEKLIDVPYFRYGIIKAEEIGDLDLNKENTYLARNFEETVTWKDVYYHSYDIGENTSFSYSGTLWGGYSIYNHTPTYLTSQYIFEVLYNNGDGIFYYETQGDLFPVVRLTAEYDGIEYDYSYDFTKKMYRNMNTTGAAYATEKTVVEDVDVDEILNQDYITFDDLEKYGYSYEAVHWIVIDEVNNEMRTIKAVEPSYLEGEEVTAETDYYPEGNILKINHTDEDVTDTYWVVCVKPESVGSGWSDNLFVQANRLIDLAYGLRYIIYVIMLVSLALGIFCFVFLISAAGHRKGSEEIQEAAIDILPFDIYLVLAGFVEFFLLQMMVELSYNMGDLTEDLPAYILFCGLGLCICWVALETVLTFAVRVKTKRWWSNTVICRTIKGIGRGVRFFIENLPILWKTMLLWVIVLFAELIITVVLAEEWDVGIWFWLLEKLLLTAVIFLAVVQMKKLQEGGEKIAEGDLAHQVDVEKMFLDFKEHGENLNRISEGMSHAVDERMKSERFKTELITNVSHDIKTPLTSIINYVDLLEKEELQNDTAKEYLEVLERQSGRLKKLIEDLIEASKASSGSLPVHTEKLEAGVFMVQTVGEFEEKTKASELELLIKKPEEPVYIMADGRHFWRIIDNLMNNICKYAQPSTRVYIDMEVKEEKVYITFRNTSKYPLNISSEELMERFVRGDSSRNTEGSGLGISIAKSLTELLGGTFHLSIDGDLFKVELAFSICV